MYNCCKIKPKVQGIVAYKSVNGTRFQIPLHDQNENSHIMQNSLNVFLDVFDNGQDISNNLDS